MGKRKKRDAAFASEDYDLPTEPVQIPAPAASAPQATEFYMPTETLPAAYPYPAVQPYIDQDRYTVPAYQAQPYPVARPSIDQQWANPAPAYPVLPQAPRQKYRGTPPGGAPPVEWKQQRTTPLYKSVNRLITFISLLVRLVLLARVVCMVMNIQSTTTWLTLLYQASDLFMWPMTWLVSHYTIPLIAGTQLLLYLEYIVAIIAYGLLARLLKSIVRILAALW